MKKVRNLSEPGGVPHPARNLTDFRGSICRAGSCLTLGRKPNVIRNKMKTDASEHVCVSLSVVRYSSLHAWLPKQLSQVSSPGARLQVQFSLRGSHLNLGICM